MKYLLLVFLLAAAGCGRGQKQPAVIGVEANDPAMQAAMQKARDAFPEFWKAVSADRQRSIPVLECAMVKARFSDSPSKQGDEHMWVNQVEFDGQLISGILSSTPNELRSVKAGQKVSFPLERLSDWLLVEHGKARGVFTVQLLRSRMSDQERRAHDGHYPFRFE